jgi:radical SAM superfamily enzyme YgiQ (UPF0313 family)
MELILTTLNARYTHASLALRSLRANLGASRARSVIREFTISQRPVDIVEALLAESPKVIGLGVYIWNASESREVARLLKQLAPGVKLVLGGPEVSFELEGSEWLALADHVITGEGEVAFTRLAELLLEGVPVSTQIIPGGLPDVKTLQLPYGEYSDEDLAHRVVYVEASRGCPFSCEFCLSSLDEKVRNFPLESVLAALTQLVARGAKQFKFIDRTFNLSPKVSHALLDFFLEREGLFAHFEVVPDRFPEALRGRIERFSPGSLQLEVGIQTFDAETAKRISRPQNNEVIEANLRWLAGTGAHVHADLIIGLPGEDAASFGRGFDRLVATGPAEVQVGILKRLKGTPITRHDAAYSMVCSHEPPYEILSNALIPFAELQRLKRFARVWDLIANRGHFPQSVSLLWERSGSPFASVLHFSEWLNTRASLGGVALARLAELFLEYLVEQGHEREAAGLRLAKDFSRAGQHVPAVLQPWVKAVNAELKKSLHADHSPSAWCASAANFPRG